VTRERCGAFLSSAMKRLGDALNSFMPSSVWHDLDIFALWVYKRAKFILKNSVRLDASGGFRM
jgi:hypothetical protein